MMTVVEVVNSLEAGDSASATTHDDSLQLSSKALIWRLLMGYQEVLKDIKAPTNKLSIFISSTFTDTHTERSILIEEILPALQARAAPYEIAVTFSDMRFGVKDENTANHDTWIVCRKEIDRCYQESDDLFFLSLQGSKYGYRPIPKQLPVEVVEEIKRQRAKMNGKELEIEETSQRMFEKWYRLDENCIPSSYVLKPLGPMDQEIFWKEVIGTLRSLLKDVVMERSPSGQELFVGRSVTEWETKYALGLDAALCGHIYRPLSGFKGFPQAFDYCDTIENESMKLMLKILLDELHTSIDPNYFTKLPDVTFDAYISAVRSYQPSRDGQDREDNYLHTVKGYLTTLLSDSLDKVINKKIAWKENALRCGLPDTILAEFLHHTSFQRLKCDSFLGREDLLDDAMNKILEIEQHRSQNASSYACISCCIIGPSGSGKTALMSMLATRLRYNSKIAPSVPVIIRYCGTSRESSDGFALVRSLILQIRFAYQMENHYDKKEVSPTLANYNAAISELHALLTQYPIILFIDSIDQLSDRYQERSHISFLKNCQLHPDGRIVISTLPDEWDHEINKWVYHYNCDSLLAENDVTRITIPLMSGSDRDVAKTIIVRTLERYQKRLTSTQWLEVDKSLFSSSSSILFLTLICDLLITWPSYHCDYHLPTTVKDVINYRLDKMEQFFGPILIRHIASYLSFSKEGVTEVEIVDLLSMDDELLQEVCQYSKLAHTQRVPFHVWARVRQELSNMIVEQSNGRLRWYHRQLWETTRERYFMYAEQMHKNMAVYFGNLVSDTDRQHRLIAWQPLVIQNKMDIWSESSNVNVRRCAEAPYHMIKASMWADAIQELCNLDAVCAYARSGFGYSMIGYLSDLRNAEAIMQDPTIKEVVEHYFCWLRGNMSIIASNPILNILITLHNEPKVSIPRQQIESKVFENGQLKWRCRRLGGYINFPNLLQTLEGHTDSVNSVCMSADGQQLISGSRDKTVKVWDVASGQCIVTLEGHTDSVSSVFMSADGKQVISGSDDKTMKMWDIASGQCKITLDLNSVYMSTDGKFAVSGSGDTTIKVWDIAAGVCTATLEGHTDSVSSVFMSADGKQVISGSWDSTIKVWDVASGQCIVTLEGHTDCVNSVRISTDGKYAVSGSFDKTVKVWDIAAGVCTTTLEDHVNTVTSVCISADGQQVISGSWDSTMKVWDVASGQCIVTQDEHLSFVNSVCMSVDGKCAVSGSDDKTIKIWDVAARQCAVTLEGHSSAVTSVYMSADGKYAVSGSYDSSLKVWDVASGQCITTLEEDSAYLSSVTISADGKQVISASNKSTVKVWDVASGQCTATLEGHTDCVTSVGMSTDGKFAVSGSGDTTIKVWDIAAGVCTATLEGHTDSVSSVFMSADGKQVISGSDDKTMKMWDVASGQCIVTLEGHTHYVSSVCTSGNGKYAVSGSFDKTVKIWDVTSGQCIETLEGHAKEVNSVCMSTDGKYAVSGSEDQTMKVWDISSGQCIATLEGHTGTVNSVGMSADGKQVISGSRDKTVKVWDIASGQRHEKLGQVLSDEDSLFH